MPLFEGEEKAEEIWDNLGGSVAVDVSEIYSDTSEVSEDETNGSEASEDEANAVEVFEDGT